MIFKEVRIYFYLPEIPETAHKFAASINPGLAGDMYIALNTLSLNLCSPEIMNLMLTAEGESAEGESASRRSIIRLLSYVI